MQSQIPEELSEPLSNIVVRRKRGASAIVIHATLSRRKGAREFTLRNVVIVYILASVDAGSEDEVLQEWVTWRDN